MQRKETKRIYKTSSELQRTGWSFAPLLINALQRQSLTGTESIWWAIALLPGGPASDCRTQVVAVCSVRLGLQHSAG